MVDAVKFRIDFHGPFRVGTGQAGRGADTTIDRDEPLPATSIKGAMRAAAAGLGIADELLSQVFGAPARAGSWAFGSPHRWQAFGGPSAGEGFEWTRRARIRIDDDTGVVASGALFFAEEVWARAAWFDVEPLVVLDDDTRRRHEATLRIAARAVHALGADRTRGLGWVDIVPEDPGDLDRDLDVLELGR